MSESIINKEKPDVPTQVFDAFIDALTEEGVTAEVVARLRKTLLEDKAFGERALKAAILSEDPLL